MLSWYDAAGRVTAPPLPDQLDLSAARLYLFFNKQKIKVTYKKHESLGLFIRGGQEYGLGIYVTKVIPNSPSDRGGIQPGDQILKCNGRSFLGITHQQAVQVLRSSRSVSMLIDRVGKIPALVVQSEDNGSVHAEQTQTEEPQRNNFARRNWLMLRSAAEALLSPDETSHILHCIARYTSRAATVANLVDQLSLVLNTKLKTSIMPYVRNFVEEGDLDRFDAQLLKKELESLTLRRHSEHHRAIPQSDADTIDDLDNVSVDSSGSSEPDQRQTRGYGGCTCGKQAKFPPPPKEVLPPVPYSLNSSRSLDLPSTQSTHQYQQQKKQTVRSVKRRSAPPVGPGAAYGTWVSTSTSSDKGYQSEDELLAKNVSWERPAVDMSRATSVADISAEPAYHDLWARAKKVWIPKIYPNLGLRIAGGARTKQKLPVVVRIEPFGCASEASGLREGSVILGVDGQSLVGLDHEEVVWKIARSFRNKATKLMTLNVVNSAVNL